jgi:hypothetical protein
VVTWEDVYEMDLSRDWSTRRRSLDLMANYVTDEYVDDDGENQTTAAAQNATSISQYGRREELLTFNNFDQTAAAARRNRYLKKRTGRGRSARAGTRRPGWR